MAGQVPDLLRRPAQGVAQQLRIGDILGEGALLGDRLALAGAMDVIVRNPAGLQVHLGAGLRPEVSAQHVDGETAHIAHRLHPQALEPRSRLDPDTAQHRERHGVQEGAHPIGRNDGEAVGLAEVGGKLGDAGGSDRRQPRR